MGFLASGRWRWCARNAIDLGWSLRNETASVLCLGLEDTEVLPVLSLLLLLLRLLVLLLLLFSPAVLVTVSKLGWSQDWSQDMLQ